MSGNKPGSKDYVTHNKDRMRKMRTLTLTDEAYDKLAKLAEAAEISKSALVEALVLKQAQLKGIK